MPTVAKRKQDKLRDEYRARQFYEASTKVPKEYESGGHTFRLTYRIASADDRQFQFSSACPINGCGTIIRAEDGNLRAAVAMMKRNIDIHVNSSHKKQTKRAAE